jgi:catechol 2,3-dioxygenase-like lactoylglutathione lyase family enzyme
MIRFRSVASAALLFAYGVASAQDPAAPPAHFHHVHVNATDPKSSIDFYTSKFDCEKGRFAGHLDAVWARKSWVLFTKVDAPASHEIVSAIWHIGWGAEDMPATYRKQLESGTKFQTPITDISKLAGRSLGSFFYAYVDGPDHELIELNTANHHHFGHIHLLSLDPVAAGEWYNRHLGIPVRLKQTEKRVYEGFPVAPASFLQADNVSIIIYPVEYARVAFPKEWTGRKDFESTKGRVIDHIGFSVDNLQQTMKRLRADGVKITDEPRSAAGGRVKYALIEGPDHISIELVEGQAAKE